MVRRKYNECCMMFLYNYPGKMYLAKFYKFIFFMDLLTYKETGKRFFDFEYILDSICPVPKELHETIKDKSFLERYPYYNILIQGGRKFGIRNINITKISLKNLPETFDLSYEEMNRISRIKTLYGMTLPSNMYEKDILGKNYYKKEMEFIEIGKKMDMDWILNKIPIDNKSINTLITPPDTKPKCPLSKEEIDARNKKIAETQKERWRIKKEKETVDKELEEKISKDKKKDKKWGIL